MDVSDGYNRKRLTVSILEQRFRNGFYDSIPPHHYTQQTTCHEQQHHRLNLDFNHEQLIINKFQSQQQLSSFKQSNSITNNEQQQAITNRDKINTSYNKDQMALLVAEVKKRLSLPIDTSLPDGFLTKHQHLLFNSSKQPLSRILRRKSLLEIGFGQMSTYTKQHVLGAGTYSTVYKGTSRLTNKLVALKEIHLEREEGIPFTAIREVSLLKQLKHNNIITLHDVIYTKNTLTLVFEFVDRDLSRYMNDCDHRMNLNNVKLFLYQILRGLRFCHDRRVLHRDLKPQNILISLSGELKLADFGLARAKSVPAKTFTDEVVTLWYRPPDVLLGNIEYGTSIDMWGVGCIFFEMAAGHTLFTGSNPKKQIEGIFEIIGTPDEDTWPDINSDLECCSLRLPKYPGRDLKTLAPNLDDCGIDLLSLFLKCNPQYRISAHNAMLHSYFNSLPNEVHNLSDNKSIFSISSIRLSKEFSKTQVENVQV